MVYLFVNASQKKETKMLLRGKCFRIELEHGSYTCRHCYHCKFYKYQYRFYCCLSSTLKNLLSCRDLKTSVLYKHCIILYHIYVCQYFAGNISNSVHSMCGKPARDIEQGVITGGTAGRSSSRYAHRNGCH